jgi:hypothetical protein
MVQVINNRNLSVKAMPENPTPFFLEKIGGAPNDPVGLSDQFHLRLTSDERRVGITTITRQTAPIRQLDPYWLCLVDASRPAAFRAFPYRYHIRTR